MEVLYVFVETFTLKLTWKGIVKLIVGYFSSATTRLRDYKPTRLWF